MLSTKFLHQMKALLGEEEYLDFYQSLGNPKLIRNSVRLNTLKISRAEFQKLFPDDLEPVPWCMDGFYIGNDIQPSLLPYYHAGLYYIQESSAMLPVELMKAQPGEKILDLCAAPGGKATQIGAAMKNKGLLVLNDLSGSRLKIVTSYVEKFGIRNSIVINHAPGELTRYFPAFFDRILIDAPCSGEGMFRQNPVLSKSWENQFHPSKFINLQSELLQYAAEMLAPGGILVYSTCTFNPDENENQIKNFLDRFRNFTLAHIAPIPQVEPGRGSLAGSPELNQTARIWPHRSTGEGHFAAVMQKDQQPGGKIFNSLPGSNENQARNEETLRPYRDFCNQAGLPFPEGEMMIAQNKLFLLPEYFLPKYRELRSHKIGLFLGEVAHQKFIPSHAYALALPPDQIRDLQVPVNPVQAGRYLKGEVLSDFADLSPGWRLITFEGFTLGWIKNTNPIVKNYYPAYLRQM